MHGFLRAARLAVCSAVLALTAWAVDGEVPFDPRWDYPQYLGFRPGEGERLRLDPPQFSWPHEPGVRAQRGEPAPAREFVLEISSDPTFVRPAVSRRVGYNFFNALAPLGPGTRYWRVGYARPGAPADRWSAVRTFTIGPDAVAWDRSGIDRAAEILAKKPRPRFGPAGGEWGEWLAKLKREPTTAKELSRLLARCLVEGFSGGRSELARAAAGPAPRDQCGVGCRFQFLARVSARRQRVF